MARKRKPESDETDEAEDAQPVIVVDDTAAELNALLAAQMEGPAGDSGVLEGAVVGQVGADFAGDAAQQAAAGQVRLEATEAHSDDGDTDGTPLGGFGDLQSILDARHPWGTGEGGGQGGGSGTLGELLDSEMLSEAEAQERIAQLVDLGPYAGMKDEPKLSDYQDVHGNPIGGIAPPDLNPLDDGGEQDPLSHGLGTIAGRLGAAARGLIVSTDDQSHTGGYGKGMIADGDFKTVYNQGGRKIEHFDTADRLIVRQTTTTDTKVGTRTEIITYDPNQPELNVTTVETVNTKSGVMTSHSTDANGDTTTVVDRPKGNKTTTTTEHNDDGSVTKTTTVQRPDGSVTSTSTTTTTPPPPKEPGAAGDPGSDENAPLPEEFQAMVDAQLGDLLAAVPHRSPDDGAVDESPEADVVGSAEVAPDAAHIKLRGMLENPGGGDSPVLDGGGGAPAFNAGAHGIDGLIQGDFEGSHTLGPEEKATNSGPIEPSVESDGSESDETDDGDDGSSFLTVAQPDLAAVVDIVPDEITIAVVDDVDDSE